MSEEEGKIIWKGPNPIRYDVDIYKSPAQDDYDYSSHWKYVLTISGAGPYEDAYLNGDYESISFLADTKEGVIRDFASFLDDQVEDREHREEYGLPPDPLNLKNVKIVDHSAENDFKDIDIPHIFAHAHELGRYITNLPRGEKPYAVILRDNEDEGDSEDPQYYVSVYALDTPVAEELENPSYDLGQQFYDIPRQEVISLIKHSLAEEQKDMPTPATPENTKLVDLTEDHTITLNKIFAEPLKLMKKSIPAMHLINKKERVPEPTTLAEGNKKDLIPIEEANKLNQKRLKA